MNKNKQFELVEIVWKLKILELKFKFVLINKKNNVLEGSKIKFVFVLNYSLINWGIP